MEGDDMDGKMPTLGIHDVKGEGGGDLIVRYEEIKRALASMCLEEEEASSSSSSWRRSDRLHALCAYLAQDTQERDTMVSPFQLARLISLVRKHVVPKCIHEGWSIQRYDLMLATVTLNCIMRNAVHYSWERILVYLMRRDLVSEVPVIGGENGPSGVDEGWVGKLYNVAFPLLIECAVNDDCIGIKRIDSQYESIGCSILHFVDELGWTLLHHAVHNKSLRVVKFLITECHFSVNEATKGNNGYTSLHIASSHHHYEMIETLLDLGASRELLSRKNETALDLLVTSGRSSTCGNSKSIFQSIYYLLSSVDEIWLNCTRGCMLYKICRFCDASVVEEVGTLASQSDSKNWNLDYLVQSIAVLLRKGAFGCVVSLLQKFQDFVFEMTKLPGASKGLSTLLNEAFRSESILTISLVCKILGPTTQYEQKGFLSSQQLSAHINAAILRGDLLLCKYIVENIICEKDYVYQRYELQDDIPRDGSCCVYPGGFSHRLTSMSPMLLSVFRHDTAVTNLLMTFGDPELLKESSADLVLGGAISGSLDCLKLLRSGLGDVRFYKGLLGRDTSIPSAGISPLTVIGKFIQSDRSQVELPYEELVSLFFEVERYVHSSEKAVTALSTGRFTLHNSAVWERRGDMCAQTVQACSEFDENFRKRSSNVFTSKEIDATKLHVNRCRDYWQLIGSVLESKKFTTNMRIAFKTKGDQAMNRVANMMLAMPEFSERRGSEAGWSNFIQQFPGSKIDSKISKLQSYLVRFKPAFLSTRHVPSPSNPFMEEDQWSQVKSSLLALHNDVLSSIDIARQKMKFSTPVQLVTNLLVLWLHSLVVHDSIFYDDSAHSLSFTCDALSLAAMEITRERYRLVEDYHRSLDRSSLHLPSNALSVALLSLMQIFTIDDVVMNYAEREIDDYREIMVLAKSELRLSSSGNDERGGHELLQFEEFIYVLIEEVMRFYFKDLTNGNNEEGSKARFEDDVEETVVKILILLLLPLTKQKLWGTATCLLRHIITVQDRRSLSIDKSQLYRFCTDTVYDELGMKCDVNSLPDMFAIRVISPVDFAVESCNTEFLKMFYHLFPEARMERDVASACLSTVGSFVTDFDLSFLFSDNVLESSENDQGVQDEKAAGSAPQRRYRISKDIQNWFLKMAAEIDIHHFDKEMLPGDRYGVSHGSDVAALYKVYSGSTHGLCENVNSEVVLSDGRCVTVSKFVKHINNYLFAMPAPMAARGHHFGSIYLHTVFGPGIPEYILEFIMEWASSSHVRLRYLASNHEGITPLYAAIQRTDLEVANKLIKSSTHNSKFSDYITPGLLNHTSYVRKVDLSAMFVESAAIQSQKTRAQLGTISEAPSQGEMLSATLQREFAEIRKLWSIITKTDFRQLFAVMYSSRGSTLDSVIQTKMIMSTLGIPVSRLGTSPVELNNTPSYDATIDSLFFDICPSKLSQFMSFKKATDIKNSMLRWINLRFIDTEQSNYESEYLFHRRPDVSLLALGLMGVRATELSSPKEWEVDYSSLMRLGRSETKMLSTQIAEETNTIMHFAKFNDEENDYNLGNRFGRNSLDPAAGADSLQYTLKLAYLLLEFFRQLCRARLMISISNTNIDGKHPLDKVVDDARLAALYEKHVTSTVHALCDGKEIQAMGIRSTFPFFHSVSPTEFCDAIDQVIYNSTDNKSLSKVYDTIYIAIISLLRLAGEFSISESLIAMKKIDSNQSYVRAKFPEDTYTSLLNALKLMTVQDVLETDVNRSNVDCDLMVSQLVGSGEVLKVWKDIPNFFTSLQTFPDHGIADCYGMTDRQLYTIQCIGSMLVHISALLPLRTYYLENDVQAVIRQRAVNPLCSLCTTTVTSSGRADEADVCSHLLEIGMKTIEPDGNNQIALVVAILCGKAHIVFLIFQHISTSSNFKWTLLNGKASTFSDVYFQKNSPFRYIVWNVLMLCPSRSSPGEIKLSSEYQKVVLTLIKMTNKFSFPCDSPPDACFSCLDLAALKQLPDVLMFLCQQIDLFSVGSKVTESAMNNSRRDVSLYGSKSSLRRTLSYILLSGTIPVASLNLLTRNALGPNDMREAFLIDELWPSDFNLSKTIRNHVEYIQKSGICVGDDNVAQNTERSRKLLISCIKCLQKNCKSSYYCNSILRNSTSSVELWESIHLAIASKEKEKIIIVLRSLLANREDDKASLPPLLFHVASYYNRMNTVVSYLSENAPSLLKKLDLNCKEYFDIMSEACTPLDVAVKCSNIASVRTLLSLDCPVLWSHFLYASILGSSEIAFILLTHLEHSMSEDDMKYALNDSSSLPELSAKIPRNTNLLTCICRRGFENPSVISLVERLLDLGADVNALDDYGMTCVNYAASLGCKNLARMIIQWTYDDAHVDASTKAKLTRSLSRLITLVRKFLLRRHRSDDIDGIEILEPKVAVVPMYEAVP